MNYTLEWRNEDKSTLAKIYENYILILDSSSPEWGVLSTLGNITPYVSTDQSPEGLISIKRQSMKCSRLQGRITLGEATCTALDTIAADPNTPWAMREAIKNAGEWQRTSPTMDELGWLLGYTPEQMDTLFEQAVSVVV